MMEGRFCILLNVIVGLVLMSLAEKEFTQPVDQHYPNGMHNVEFDHEAILGNFLTHWILKLDFYSLQLRACFYFSILIHSFMCKYIYVVRIYWRKWWLLKAFGSWSKKETVSVAEEDGHQWRWLHKQNRAIWLGVSIFQVGFIRILVLDDARIDEDDHQN